MPAGDTASGDRSMPHRTRCGPASRMRLVSPARRWLDTPVAQLVERLPVVLKVAGSIPAWSPLRCVTTAAVVTVELIDKEWGNGFWDPKAKVTGMR